MSGIGNTLPDPLDQQVINKKTLRRSLLNARQAMPVDQWRERSDRLCAHLGRSPQIQQARTILAYTSFRQEPDLSPLLRNKAFRWGLPRCVGQSLVWHAWSHHEGLPLQPGSFGIQEPHPQSPQIHPEEVDLILVPAVACDRRGFRLGYGGGFYDRMLSHPTWASRQTIGIVFSDAFVDALPVEDWDFPLQAVCTEEGLVSINFSINYRRPEKPAAGTE